MADGRDGIDSGGEFYRTRVDRKSDRGAAGGLARGRGPLLGLLPGRRAGDIDNVGDRHVLAMVVTPGAKPGGFRPRSLDAANFPLSDVRAALGPYLNVCLITRRHRSQSEGGLAPTVRSL